MTAKTFKYRLLVAPSPELPSCRLSTIYCNDVDFTLMPFVAIKDIYRDPENKEHENLKSLVLPHSSVVRIVELERPFEPAAVKGALVPIDTKRNDEPGGVNYV